MYDLPNFGSAEFILSFLTLTFLEIVLGIDNIIFISISAGRLPENERRKATNLGLSAAMLMRIFMLFGLSYLTAMVKPLFELHWGWLEAKFSIQNVILILGGLFLIYKSVSEIHHKLESAAEGQGGITKKPKTWQHVMMQIILIDFIFSIDSILTAVGMTSGVQGAMWIMVSAVIVSIILMIIFAHPIARFVNNHPTIQMLGLAFLILIGFLLITEGAHVGHFTLVGTQVGSIPKAYLYFAVAFSLLVEFLNLRLRQKSKPIQLGGIQRKAKEEGFFNDKSI